MTFDIRILSAVQQRGQLSKAKLTENADIALDRISAFTQVVTISLTRHRKTNFERFETIIDNRDEIMLI